MNSLKFLLSCLVLFLLSTPVTLAQNEKMKERARRQLENLNERITAGDPAQALTREQQARILDLYLDKQQDLLELRKSDLTPEEKTEKRKALNKSIARRINQEILTKDQRLAKRKSREKKE